MDNAIPGPDIDGCLPAARYEGDDIRGGRRFPFFIYVFVTTDASFDLRRENSTIIGWGKLCRSREGAASNSVD